MKGDYRSKSKLVENNPHIVRIFSFLKNLFYYFFWWQNYAEAELKIQTENNKTHTNKNNPNPPPLINK
jgi:hypothetical protein